MAATLGRLKAGAQLRILSVVATAALLCAAACDQNDLPQQAVTIAPTPSNPPSAEMGAQGSAAKTLERDILRTVAMYVEFERQAVEVRRRKHEESERRAIEARKGKSGGFVGGRTIEARPGEREVYRNIPDCGDVLSARISAEYDSDVSGLAQAARAANARAPDGALDDDHKAYLAFIEQAESAIFETRFAAEQALIHTEAIGALQDFVSAVPASLIRPWAEETLVELKDRLKFTEWPCVGNAPS